MIVKTIAFILAWTIKIVAICGLCIGIAILSPVLLGGWAMDKTFGEHGW